MDAMQFVYRVRGIMDLDLTGPQRAALEDLFDELTEMKALTVEERIPDCELPPQVDARLWAEAYIRRQIEWSARTFGEGSRTHGLTTHILKELEEIKATPHDLEEWIDVIILALDGAWRCGRQRDYSPEEILDMLDYKQQKNFDRTWVLPSDPTQPCEHDRTAELEEETHG